MLLRLLIQTFVRNGVAVSSLLLLTLQCSTAWSQSKAVDKGSCVNSIARIYSDGDRYLSKGSLLCPGDRIHPKEIGGKVEILCFLNRKILQLPSGSISDTASKCREATPGTEKKCTFQTPQNCPKFKGPGEVEENEPIILSPYGSMLLQQRPVFSWYPVPGATSYKVYLIGYNLEWQVETSDTTLPYPPNQPELQYGIVYKITVLARIGEEITSSAPSVVYMLSPSKVRDTLEKIEKVKALGLPPDEEAYLDLDTVYMERKLLNDTIQTMNQRVGAGSKNPTLYRVLGDRYLEAWLVPEAKRAYKKAIELAQSSGNTSELAIAQDRLAILIESYSQLPTRMNAAQ